MEKIKNIDIPENKINLPEGFSLTPDVIVSPYPFIAIGDLDEMINRLVPENKDSSIADNFQSDLLQIHKKNAPRLSTFYFVDQKTLIKKTENLISCKYHEETSNGNNVGIINFDKYLLANSSYENILRLNLSRDPNGILTSRPGSEMDKDTQINMMNNWLSSGNYDSIILTDDVVAFADTFGQMIGSIRNILPNVKISVVSGICSSEGEWRGKQKLEAMGANVSSVVLSVASSPIEGGSSGMAIPDSRDFTILGGKVDSTSDGRSLAFPYFYPFSKPIKSFYENGNESSGSMEFFELNQRLVKELEDIKGSRLTIGDLESFGFGVPYTSIPELKQKINIPDASILVSDYLNQIKSLT